MKQAIEIGQRIYETRLLTPPDIVSLQALFDRCADYFEIATGRAAQPDEATRAFVAGPPSKEVSDKRMIGIFHENVLIGVVDALRDWPNEGTWTMGMLLIDPDHRGDGLGTAALDAYERWAVTEGTHTFRTALVSHHERGIRFLERRGYMRDNTVGDYAAGSRVSTIQFLEKVS